MEVINLKGCNYYDSGINILGVPYGGPEYLNGNDLDRERFSEKTDTGPLPYVLTYFDHGKSTVKGRELIGVSQFLEKTDFGELYRIWVRESDEYQDYINFLQKIHQEGMLKTSSHPFQRTAEKTADGEWTTWHVVELTVCTQPANPLATSLIEEKIMEENKSENTAETPVTETEVKAEPTPTAEATTIENIAEKIKDKFTTETTVEKADISVSIYGRLDEVLKQLAMMGDQMMAMEKTQQTIIADQKKHVDMLVKGLDTFASEVAKTVTGNVKLEKAKSLPEKEVEKQLQTAVNTPKEGSALFKNMKGLG